MHILISRSMMLFFVLVTCQITQAQDFGQLKTELDAILSTYKARVGVAIHTHDFTDSLIIDGHHRFPLQSLYKFHLGIAVLDRVDKGQYDLDQPIAISKKDVTTPLYSPIKKLYPEGTTLTLRELLQYSIAKSDNVACDILFDLVGGPDAVQAYFTKNGYGDLSIKLTEQVQQKDWDLQFQNWTTVAACNRILHDYYTNDGGLLSPDSHLFLWDTMRSTQTGKDRIKGSLPDHTQVAHKTAYSGKQQTTGIIAAAHDIGVVSLPDDKVFYITVLITDCEVDEPIASKIIAEVAKAAYNNHITF